LIDEIQTIRGSFSLIELLGDGNNSFGDVYRALDNGLLKRTVAIKRLKPKWAVGSRSKLRFLEESRIIAQLDWHPKIATVYDVIESDDHFIIVMMLYEDSLGQMIKRAVSANEIGVTWEKSAHFVRQISLALELVHEAGIIHRDIKPSNILLDLHENALVADFGIAVSMADSDLEGRYGTTTYMAPEVNSNKPYDNRADIYSIGATWYHALTGSPPYGVNIKELGPHEHSFQAMPTPLQEILFKCLERDVDSRYQSCRELIDDLEQEVFPIYFH